MYVFILARALQIKITMDIKTVENHLAPTLLVESFY
tara:strand:+ start:230 stop:337 length:108 start_codon:yes stop_codon:yes gene_type:complete